MMFTKPAAFQLPIVFELTPDKEEDKLEGRLHFDKYVFTVRSMFSITAVANNP